MVVWTASVVPITIVFLYNGAALVELVGIVEAVIAGVVEFVIAGVVEVVVL